MRLWDFYFDGNQLEELPQQYPPLVNGIKVQGCGTTDCNLNLGFQHVQVSGNLLREIPEAVGWV